MHLFFSESARAIGHFSRTSKNSGGIQVYHIPGVHGGAPPSGPAGAGGFSFLAVGGEEVSLTRIDPVVKGSFLCVF